MRRLTGDRDPAAPIAERVYAWREALHSCYQAGYLPLSSVGTISMSPPEQIRLKHLMQETVNAVDRVASCTPGRFPQSGAPFNVRRQIQGGV